jgi:parvulin-like peptidyl-prolyl isomerase
VTQVVPFPVAKAGKSFVSYEDYLFEIRQYIHYFETQEKVNFSEVDGRQQLAAQRKIALQKVIDQAYIRQIAKEKRITVSDEEVDAEIELLQSQNRLGSNPEALQEIIRDYYGWTVKDFRRSLSDRVLFTKVLAALDTETTERANAALAELNAGADFSALAAKYSDDPSTKDKGGEISFLIEKVDRNVPAQMTSALYALNPGEVSGLVNVGYGLEIVKNLEEKDGKIRAAYILFNFKDMQVFLNTEKEKHKATSYIHL